MSDYDPPRRVRRNPGESPRRPRGGFPLFPLVVIVIFLGLFVGGLFAKYLGPPKIASNLRTVRPTPLPTVVLTPLATPQEPTPSPSAAPSPKAVTALTPPPKPTATAEVVYATASSRPTMTPQATSSPQTTPPPQATASETPQAPVATPAPQPRIAPRGATLAETTVRNYINALRDGNVQAAQAYLNGPDASEQSFIDSGTRVTALEATPNDDGTYKVSADLMTAKGEYYIVFTVTPTPDGDQITDKTAIKP